MKLSQILSRDANNFDLVRFLAATAVIVGHAYALTPPSQLQDPVASIVHFDYSGSLAVDVFFFLSGLLVCSSLLHSRDIVRFVTARVMRIMPGLICCVFVTAFVIGPFVTTLGAGEYLRSPQVREYFYANTGLLNLQWYLPGVFENHAYRAVNGSLWTLPSEVFMYLMLLFSGATGILFSKKSLVVSLIGAILFGYLLRVYVRFDVINREVVPPILLFVTGAFAAIYADRIRLSFLWLAALIVLTWLLHHSSLFRPMFYISLMYAMLIFASHPIIRKIRLPGDYSYGIYIYGFVVQQLVVEAFPTHGPLFNMGVSAPIAIAAGFVSWELIEKRALGMAPSIAMGIRQSVADGNLQVLKTLKSGTVAACLSLLVLPLVTYALPANLPILDEKFQITAWGPDTTQAGVPFNVQPDGAAAIWVQMNRPLQQGAQIYFGDRLLRDDYIDKNLITVSVPKSLYSNSGQEAVYIQETEGGRIIRSKSVIFTVK
jgi:peptidoglycan/LPS O-acetylase OafA/YrhL